MTEPTETRRNACRTQEPPEPRDLTVASLASDASVFGALIDVIYRRRSGASAHGCTIHAAGASSWGQPIQAGDTGRLRLKSQRRLSTRTVRRSCKVVKLEAPATRKATRLQRPYWIWPPGSSLFRCRAVSRLSGSHFRRLQPISF
ncbi:uncharacterized protein LOC142575202 isoform X1 [Dermacentor variabilis]|uniref:uncharacterized protein LOC142575202 isoform X1 n=1 Tax=Dermacentor variabilis TaxID=34621 RepID=UPI003F5BD953